MGIKTSIQAAAGVLLRYGPKTFIRQTVNKLKSHNFEKADLFLNQEQTVPVPLFSDKEKPVKGLVSVVIPCYNHEAYVGHALTSIYNQSYRDIELIVVDDASSDRSAAVIEGLFDRWKPEKRFLRQLFIRHKQNKGAHDSIDEAVNKSAGEYIAVLNSDDYYDPSRFMLMTDALEKDGAGIGFSKVAVVDKDGNIKSNSPFSAIQHHIDSSHMFLSLCADNLAISSGNLFFKRSLIEKIGLFRDFKYIHDWDFLMRAALETPVSYCPNTTYYYRMHETNSYLALKGNTVLCDSEMTEMRARVLQTIFEQPDHAQYSKEDYPKIIDLLYRRLMNSAGLKL